VAKILKAVNVEVPTVGHCSPYYPLCVVIDRGEFYLLYRRHYIFINYCRVAKKW